MDFLIEFWNSLTLEEQRRILVGVGLAIVTAVISALFKIIFDLARQGIQRAHARRRSLPKITSPPTGTVTLLFTDIEGSTLLWQQHPTAMSGVFARHHSILRRAIEANQGYVFQIVGDEFCAAFSVASNGLRAALDAQRALRDEPWGEIGALRVRIALHSGVAEMRAGDYTSGEYASGLTLSRCARLLACGHGGQVLMSQATRALTETELPADTRLRDLGEHRLKGLAQPERIFQLIVPDFPADFPPLRTLDAVPNNLPIQLTSFVGREREMEEVRQLLTRTRLLTLSGAGGVGKTRLAVELGAVLPHQFSDGVWLIELEALTDPARVPQTVASVLGVREESRCALIVSLIENLREKNLLLIVDNCEHLIGACAEWAQAILRGCPHIRILATSREALNIAGEVVYRVPSLALPDPRELPAGDNDLASTVTQFDAAQLFTARAIAASPTFMITDQNARTLARICHRLDGIPLALELAAARVKGLSLEQIAARLDDQFSLLAMGRRTALPRQQTIRALIDWSYNLLSPAESKLFMGLSVFVGGWTLEAAESVCGAENSDVMNLLTQLVDKSLVTVSESEGTETRYRLLETLRQYALEKLRASGEEEMLRQKHRDWFLRLAEEAEPHLRGAEQGAWLNRLEAEYANLLAALDWMAARAQDTSLALRLAGALWNFWNIRGYWSEGRERLNRVLASPGASAHASARAKALIGAGFLALLQADYAAAQELLNESRAIAQQATDLTLAAYALYGLGSIAQRRGDAIQATALFNNALERFRAVGDQWGIASALLNLGSVRFYQDDYAEAHSFFNASLAAFRQLGDKRSIAKVLSNLGLIEYHRQNYSDARALYEASLAVRRELRDKFGVAHQLDNLGYIALRQQNYEQARDLFVESLTLYRAMKSKRHIADVLYGIAGAIAAQGKPECAAQLIGAAEALLEAMGAQVETSNRAEYDRSVAMARARMDAAAFETARVAGRALTMEQAIEYALAE